MTDEDIRTQTARIEALQKEHNEALLAKLNVIGTGIGYATVADELTDIIALIVMVEKKLPPEELDEKDMLPTELDDVRVDVQELGVFTAY